MSTLSRRSLLVVSAALLATSGCMPKTAPVRAPQAWSAGLVGVLTGADTSTVAGLPPGVVRRLLAALDARGLSGSEVPVSGLSQALLARRDTPQRWGWLAENTAPSDLLFLVEASAFYDTQIQGRLRWTVHSSLTIGLRNKPDSVLTRSIDAAVFLQFLHQKEADAVAEAALTIERAAARLLDDWLRGLG